MSAQVLLVVGQPLDLPFPVSSEGSALGNPRSTSLRMPRCGIRIQLFVPGHRRLRGSLLSWERRVGCTVEVAEEVVRAKQAMLHVCQVPSCVLCGLPAVEVAEEVVRAKQARVFLQLDVRLWTRSKESHHGLSTHRIVAAAMESWRRCMMPAAG